MILFCMLQHLKENKEFIFVNIQETNGIDSVLLVSHAKRIEGEWEGGKGGGGSGNFLSSEIVLKSNGYNLSCFLHVINTLSVDKST